MWVKIDDGFPFHRKAIIAGKDGRALYITALCWSSGQLTDGFIDLAAVPMLAAISEVANAEAIASHLVEVGLWEEADGGYIIHDYHDYNPDSEKVKAIRKARSEAGRRGGLASGEARQAKPEANGQAKPKQNQTPSPSPSPCSYHEEKDSPALALYREILSEWSELFPSKTQPKENNAKNVKKTATRMGDSGFTENWRAALRRASRSTFCNAGGWFQLAWFLGSEEHWTNCHAGNYDDTNGKKSEGVKRDSSGWQIPG